MDIGIAKNELFIPEDMKTEKEKNMEHEKEREAREKERERLRLEREKSASSITSAAPITPGPQTRGGKKGAERDTDKEEKERLKVEREKSVPSSVSSGPSVVTPIPPPRVPTPKPVLTATVTTAKTTQGHHSTLEARDHAYQVSS